MDAGAAPHAAHAKDAPEWDSMPASVLNRILQSLGSTRQIRKEDLPGAFKTCRAFMRAVLEVAPKPTVTIYVDAFNPGLAKPMLKAFQQQGAVLTNVTFVFGEDLLLDAEPNQLAAVFPHLRQLESKDCNPCSGGTPLAGCTSLQQLKILPSTTPAYEHSRRAWEAQLQALASLPALTSLALLNIHEYNTSFLPSLAGQLTHFDVSNLPGSPGREHMEFGQQWQAVVEQVAQLTSLRSLGLGACTANQLRMFTHLTQVQRLRVSDAFDPHAKDGDGLVSTALQFPLLTEMELRGLGAMTQSFAASPCTWTELCLREVSPKQVSQLPLHTLTHPLNLPILHLHKGTTEADVSAALANLARSSAKHTQCGDDVFTVSFADQPPTSDSDSDADDDDWDPAALLRAAAPLVPQSARWLFLTHARLGGELLAALEQSGVLHRSRPILCLSGCHINASFWPQLPRSFPLLRDMIVSKPTSRISPMTIMSYYCAAAHQQDPEEADLDATMMDLILNEANYADLEGSIDELNEQLHLLGFFDSEVRLELADQA